MPRNGAASACQWRYVACGDEPLPALAPPEVPGYVAYLGGMCAHTVDEHYLDPAQSAGDASHVRQGLEESIGPGCQTSREQADGWRERTLRHLPSF